MEGNMHFENLIYEKDGHIAKVTLNRPQKLNALNRNLLYDLRKALREVEDDDEVRVVVLKGAGRAFCAGHDYSRPEWESGGRELGDLTETHRVDMTMRVRLYLSVWDLPKPVIAQVHGACFAAGSMLAGLCDLVVVAEDAQIGPSQVPSPIGQGIYSPVWLSLIGVRKAKEYIFLGGLMDGSEAAQIGWATRAVPADELEAAVDRMAAQIARIPLEMLMIIHEQINKVNAMNTLISNLKKASEESRKTRGSEEKRYFHLSANNVLSQLQTMIEGSKSSIKIMTDQWGFGLLAECKEQLLSVLRRNLDVKVLVAPSQICSESFRVIPDGVEIRASDITQNCFIFDETELLLIDNSNGKGAIFSSTDILGINQEKVFSNIWKNAIKTKALGDMTKAEAQEIYKIIKIVNEAGLPYLLNSTMISKKPEADMFKLLEKNGVSLKSKTLDDVIEIIDAIMQITCSGHVNFEANTKNITIESKLNSGHSLPWVSILDGCLQKQGYKTRTIYQNNSSKGEKVHIKITKN